MVAVSLSSRYAESQLRVVGMGREPEAELTNDRVTNSVGELEASIVAKRWISIRWSTRWEARRKGQQVDKASPNVEGKALGGRACKMDDGAE